MMGEPLWLCGVCRAFKIQALRSAFQEFCAHPGWFDSAGPDLFLRLLLTTTLYLELSGAESSVVAVFKECAISVQVRNFGGA